MVETLVVLIVGVGQHEAVPGDKSLDVNGVVPEESEGKPGKVEEVNAAAEEFCSHIACAMEQPQQNASRLPVVVHIDQDERDSPAEPQYERSLHPLPEAA